MKKILQILLSLTLLCSIAQVTGKTPQPSLREKIGQMLIIGFQGTSLKPDDRIVQDILARRIGGVIVYNTDFQTKGERNIKDPAQLKQLTQQLQDYAKQAAKGHGFYYPLFIGIDYEGGKVNNLPTQKGFPKTVSAAEVGAHSVAAAKKEAKHMAQTLQDEGINLNFAPVLDVNVIPTNPIIGYYNRSFSADPHRVAKYAQIYAQAFHDHGILCTYKHFPGHGSSTGDTHKNFVDVSKTWKVEELIPYKKLINQPSSCSLIMIAHITNHQLDPANYPASLSHAITTDLLRNQLHFEGVIITDDLQMKAISDHYDLSTIVERAINAGADMLMFSNQLLKNPPSTEQIIDAIYNAVQAGKISPQTIDKAYARIVKIKQLRNAVGITS
jgi:beta-N-acetylhexosaminidase